VPGWGDEVQADVNPRVVIVEERSADFQLFLQIIFKLRINVLNYRPVTKTIPLATQILEFKLPQFECSRSSPRHTMTALVIRLKRFSLTTAKAWHLHTGLTTHRLWEPPEAALRSLRTAEHGKTSISPAQTLPRSQG